MTDPTAALRTAWERYFNGYLFTKPTAIRSTETSWVHRERVLFEQGWHAALASQADDPSDRKCGSCQTPNHYAGDRAHPCIPQ